MLDNLNKIAAYKRADDTQYAKSQLYSSKDTKYIEDNPKVIKNTDPLTDSLSLLKTRLNYMGGVAQQDRMIKDKRRSFNKALISSYQGANIFTDEDPDNIFRALIVPNKLKTDYDDKTILVGYEYDLKPGSIFNWAGTNTKWLIYLQDLTELAYFHGDIRRCSYKISWKDENEQLHSTWAAVIGPVEKKIADSVKHDIVVSDPNYTLQILVPKTDDTIKQFKRSEEFFLTGETTCWQVTGADYISTPGILQFNAIEYYYNKEEDDLDNYIIGGLITPTPDPNTQSINDLIVGDSFIRPNKIVTYEYTGNEVLSWQIDEKYPVEYSKNPKNPFQVRLRWKENFGGQFILQYGQYQKIIVVESLI